jgi:MYXO-CTERM domain-containing protein
MTRKISLPLAIAFATLGGLNAQIQSILPAHYGVTGIRQDSGGNVLITGGTDSPSLNTLSPAFLYYGALDAIPSATNGTGLYTYTPSFGGVAITGGAQFYGPNTPLFNPSIGSGNIRAVGAYRATLSAPYQDGMIYTGPVGGNGTNGTWTSIQVPANGSNLVGDTIPHSTMGDLVVGNFDLQSNVAAGQGFIYDMANPSSPWSTFSLGSYSTTFYGIWQNGGPFSTKYTVVGGISDVINGGKGLVFNYDSSTQIISNQTQLSFNNDPSVITHFEGISAVDGGFSLTSTTLQGAGYAFLPVNNDGSFGTPTWTAITNNINPSAATTGDTVIDNRVLGVFSSGGAVSSYITTTTPVPEPGQWGAMMGASLLGLAALRRRRLS